MFISRIRIVVFFIVLFFSTFIFAKNSPKDFPGQISVEVLQKPTPMIAMNKYYLVYELHLVNYQNTPITLTSLKVEGNDGYVAKYSGKELEKMMHAIGVKEEAAKDVLKFQPGAAKMIYVWLSFNKLEQIPNSLKHEIHFAMKIPKPNTNPVVKTDAMVVDKTLGAIIGAPLHGDYWVAGNGPSNSSGHREANMVFNGHDYFAQRYAIDFVQVDKEGKSYQGDKTKNSNYYCYGKDVIAVASGRVIAVHDGIPENTPTAKTTAVPITYDTIGGNYIVLDIGNNKYAFYAHLIPGSLKVKVGDVVHQGQAIARLGNTGNSTEPHLHFHVVDGPSFIAANGVPYRFDEFAVRPSKAITVPDTIEVKVLDDQLTQYKDQLVLENTLMKFRD